MDGITQGRLDLPIPRAGRDEIGGMARALAMLRDNLIESKRLEQERQRAEAGAARPGSAGRGDRGHLRGNSRSMTQTTGWSSATPASKRCTRASLSRSSRARNTRPFCERWPGRESSPLLRRTATPGSPSGLSETVIPRAPSNSSAAVVCGSKSASGVLRMGGPWASSPIRDLKDRELQLGQLVDRLAEARDVADQANRTKSISSPT